MITEDKKLLIVDDSEIDRTVLKNILQNEFEIIEADNGYAALEIILHQKQELDAILLDVSMPVLDGFNVLQFLKENEADHIPVFLITAEATKDNVEKAVQYNNLVQFIKKPYDQREILRRLKEKLGVIASCVLSGEEIAETNQYISDLEALYQQYLADAHLDDTHYIHMRDLMKMLLKRYVADHPDGGLDEAKISLISKAAYFCDIGRILLPDGSSGQPLDGSHVTRGADLLRLNYSKRCEYFVYICSEMCMHHHERFDGKGFPHGLSGNGNPIYSQMCRLVEEFDCAFSRCPVQDAMRFDFITKDLAKDEGLINQELFPLLTDCRDEILAYYTS